MTNYQTMRLKARRINIHYLYRLSVYTILVITKFSISRIRNYPGCYRLILSYKLLSPVLSSAQNTLLTVAVAEADHFMLPTVRVTYVFHRGDTNSTNKLLPSHPHPVTTMALASRFLVANAPLTVGSKMPRI